MKFKVIKRTGDIENFSKTKIKKSIMAAFKESKIKFDIDVYHRAIEHIEDGCDEGGECEFKISDIQDYIERAMNELGYCDVAKRFILYRHEHDRIREFVKQKEDFIQRYKEANNTANATIDDNSNVGCKNIGVMNSELHKGDNLHVNRKMVMNKLKELYPDFDSKQYLRDLNSHIIYKHDESSMVTVPYCCAITMYPFITDGLKKLGGLSAAPKNLDSYCGMFVNLIFAVSSMFAGACMYKDQKLKLIVDGERMNVSAKEFCDSFGYDRKFENWQGVWEISDISDKNVYVNEYNRVVKVNKVMRRRYDGRIYKIETDGGLRCDVSQDHVFKAMVCGRSLSIKACELKKDDSLCVDRGDNREERHSFTDSPFDKISFVGTYPNDDEYVYEIETESHWYNCGGMITHNCAVPEALLYFDYYARKEWGDDYYKKNDYIAKPGKDLLDLLNKTHYWCNTIRELKEHDFGEYNEMRDAVILNADRKIERDDMESWERTLAETGNAELKLGDDTRTIRSVIRQCFQQIIYSINQPAAARGMQSAFVNFSYFDKYYFDGMFGNFTFPDFTSPIWESFNWLQREFMMWFNEERTKTMLTFPVESFAMLYKDGKFQDEDSFDFVSSEYERGHSFFTYISDSVDSLSSCCFDGNQLVKLKTKESGEPVFMQFSDAATMCGGKVFVQSPSFDGKAPKWVAANVVKASSKHFVKVTVGNSCDCMTVTSDHIFPVLNKELERGFADVPAGELKVGMSMMRVDNDGKNEWMEITRVENVEYETDVDAYCFEICDGEKPYFLLPSGIVSHNCRLKNKLQTEFAFTNGNIGVETGSKSVITLNLNRIVQDWYKSVLTKDDSKMLLRKSNFVEGILSDTENWGFRDYIVSILERVYKYHEAYNELLWDMYDADLLPAYSAGFINLDKQYLTIGLNGLNQAAEFMEIRCSDNEKYAKFCQTVFGIIKEQNALHKTKKMMFNTEQVPAESLAVKNYKWDKEDGYWVPTDTNLYASYVFKPNDESISVLEKLRLHGKNYIGDYLDGGAAAHINLSEHLSREQYKKILEYSASVGCQYLTFNVPNTECRDCGHITKSTCDKCPKCGSDRLFYWDRVIGYLTRIDKWSDGRQKEQKTRVYENFSQKLK